MKKHLYFSAMIIVVVGCSAPMSKESYLKKFNAFITEVSENHKTYSEKDWERQTKKYQKFSGEWYEKFKSDFTFREEVVIRGNRTKWQYYLRLNQASAFVRGTIDRLSIREMKDQVEFFINNNMKDDLLKFYEDAQKAGKDAQNAVNDIFKELQINVNELR